MRKALTWSPWKDCHTLNVWPPAWGLYQEVPPRGSVLKSISWLKLPSGQALFPCTMQTAQFPTTWQFLVARFSCGHYGLLAPPSPPLFCLSQKSVLCEREQPAGPRLHSTLCRRGWGPWSTSVELRKAVFVDKTSWVALSCTKMWNWAVSHTWFPRWRWVMFNKGFVLLFNPSAKWKEKTCEEF